MFLSISQSLLTYHCAIRSRPPFSSSLSSSKQQHRSCQIRPLSRATYQLRPLLAASSGGI
ncbi:hypothetical protein PILCRDRAFT_257418 [Piloderma croceum F 1598]|uniref:Uncharacterized protein n=1 Tax=Piloderma croceum (strain F 1598) TaxID=765440 RepID=A0A0C3GCU8_PILCF|nr:hypothetical protein PILCRDRAFT_257418 [Piloderma croceum F 1598]